MTISWKNRVGIRSAEFIELGGLEIICTERSVRRHKLEKPESALCDFGSAIVVIRVARLDAYGGMALFRIEMSPNVNDVLHVNDLLQVLDVSVLGSGEFEGDFVL